VNIKSMPIEQVFVTIGDTGVQTLMELCKSSQSYGMFISIPRHLSDEEVIKAAPYLADPENSPILVNGFGFFIFQHEDDLKYAFDLTVGDKGPNLWNDYKGPAKVYALTCGPDGVQLDENT
jgi:hypothetical protein